MKELLARYTHWLHGQWPAGLVEKLPEVREDGETNVRGVRIVGDLTGIPLLKFSADTGARAVAAILAESDFQRGEAEDEVLDLAIIGGGVSGISAAIEASKAGLNFKLFEAVDSFATIRNFPKGKPIYTYPTEMTPSGQMRFEGTVKESLLEELTAQQQAAGIVPTLARIERVERKGGELLLHRGKDQAPYRARRVIVAIGRSGNFRKLKVPGEELEKVMNRLHDPKDYDGKQVVVVGGGDSALEGAIALAEAGAQVTLSYRKPQFSRPKPDNVERLEALGKTGALKLHMASQVRGITEEKVVLELEGGQSVEQDNDFVFIMIGREPPLDFFRRSGLNITGALTPKFLGTLAAFFLFTVALYHWMKGGLPLYELFVQNGWFPFNLSSGDPKSLLGSIANASRDPGFYYSLAYCVLVAAFGIRRIRRRKTPYVKVQTFTLMAFQIIPLFLLPYIVLPWMGANGAFSNGGFGQWFGDTFFPGESYWRAFGFILAWPLFIWNVFTEQPVWGWLVLSLIQTFVIIPLIVWRWGKGAYCGWVCSCGALAETLGDAHRHKMPHGPFWNRLNMVGQVVLALAFLLLALRIAGWIFPQSGISGVFEGLLKGIPVLNYKYLVDIWLAGIIGIGLYFHFSGRVWCRFACPLAALMHIYARFTRFRIFADKKKCISCNVCTSVCHQGIDIMNFANKGLPMEDPECVRCSACVQSCPTGVLTFGHLDAENQAVFDKLAASQVQMREARKG